MEAEGGVFDVLGGAAVVVDDRHPVARLQKLLAFHHVGTVGIHHDQQGAGAHLQKRLVSGEEHALILRQGAQLVQHRRGGIALQVDDDLGPLAPVPGGAAKARRGTHGVHIRKAVAHDIDLRGVRHQLAEGVGHDPGLDLGALFRGLGPAAVEGKVHLTADHRLVAAPAEGHLHREVGVFVELGHGVGVLAHADGEGGMHALAHLDVPDSVQHGEPVLGKVVEVLFFKDEQVVVPGGLQQRRAGKGRPGGELFVDLGQDAAAGGIRAGLHEIVVVVDEDHGHHRTGGGVLFPPPRPLARTRLPYTRKRREFMMTRWGLSCLPSSSHWKEKAGTASSTFISKRCSRTPASCKKFSLLQMTSPVSGRNTIMGRGELMRVDLLAVSTLPVRLSMYCSTPWRRFWLDLVKYT